MEEYCMGIRHQYKVMEKCGYSYLNEEFGAEDDPYGKGMFIYKCELD